ncbi:MAG: FKBP-type peptidyl-prolyl cis-trans isomerase [Nitrososphaerota archaeon]|nr:peptidylprolyl isomerase [Candidatus Geocrenenecus dongiae]
MYACLEKDMSAEDVGKSRTTRAKRKKAETVEEMKTTEEKVESREASGEVVKEAVLEEVKTPVKVEAGSFVLVDYIIKIKETGEIVDTTIEEVGKGVFEAGKTYEPKLVIPGKGFLLKAIEEELIGMETGQEKLFEIPPEKAFGQRDPGKVKIIPLRRLKDVEGPITVGSRIVVDGREGIVRSIESGRVQVDFNPYLAGKTLECSVKIVKIIGDKLEKIKALIHTRIPDVDVEKFSLQFDGGEVKITVPREAYLLPAIQASKRVLARDIIENISDVERVVYLEMYDRTMFQ